MTLLGNIRWKWAQTAELRWWKKYLSKRSKEDYLVWKKNYWKNFLSSLNICITENERVLDAGCGPAGLFTILNNQKVTAVDPLLDSYEASLPHFKKADYPWATFITSSLEDFDSPEPFETVFCLNAINHVQDIDVCWDVLLKSTQKGGKLIVSIDVHNYNIFKWLFRLIQHDTLHPHQYNLKEYQDMLERRGVKILQTQKITSSFFFDYYILVGEK